MHRQRVTNRWRTAFLAIVAANVGLFAWAYALAPPDPALDPRPLANQIDPGQMKILSPAELAATPPPPKPAPSSCIEWGTFTLAAAPRARCSAVRASS